MNKLFSSNLGLSKSLLANFFSLIIYLLLVFNNGILGYIAVPLFIAAYIFVFCTSVFLIVTGLKINSAPFLFSALFSIFWVVYGIGSEFLSHGINFKIMISLLMLSLIVNFYFYLNTDCKIKLDK